MRLLSIVTIIIAAATFGPAASSQTACPVGTAPGSATCGPGPGAYVEPPPPTPAGEWSSRYGAVASDPTGTGNIGVAENKASQEDAEREALSQCHGLGGGRCVVDMWYANQCAAIASPYRGGIPAAGHPASRSGKTIQRASASADRVCMTANANKPDECRIIYSGCSAPVFRRY